ncbi:MAG: hypothetical protein LR015_03420 [Verrucomicrobia bacterium]|nr:hypothetical protein [Verrucomicrobiota bacterium]
MRRPIPQQAASLTIREVVEYAQLGKEGPIVPGATLKASPQGGMKWHEIKGQMRVNGGDSRPLLRKGN